MLNIRNQLICLSIAMLLVVCFQPDQINGQMKKKKAILKGLMGASLLKLLKPKKGILPIPLPLPLPIDWVNQQAGLMNKNNPPAHVSHQPYAPQGIPMSPIEYSDYQNAISQALSNSNSYIPNYSSGSSSSSGSGYPNSASSGQNENTGYSNNVSNGYDSNSGSNNYDNNSGSNNYDNNSGSNNYDSNSGSNNYDNNSGSNDDNSNYGSNSNAGQTSYGVAGVGQNDEYNAYQVSNGESASNSYRAAASSLNPNYNLQFNQQANGYNYGYLPSYNQFNQQNTPQEYSQPAPMQNNEQQSQFNNYQNSQSNQQSNYEDNSGSASSQSYVATPNQPQTNNYIPLRSVQQPIYHNVQSGYQQSTSQQQPNYASNGWVALD